MWGEETQAWGATESAGGVVADQSGIPSIEEKPVLPPLNFESLGNNLMEID